MASRVHPHKSGVREKREEGLTALWLGLRKYFRGKTDGEHSGNGSSGARRKRNREALKKLKAGS